VRAMEGGNLFGLRRGGLTLRRLHEEHPHGKVVRPALRGGVRERVVLTPDRRVRLDAPAFASELERLAARAVPEGYPLRLIGMRELRSENSWMHNAPLLLRGGRRHLARVHPADAAAIGAEDGAVIRVTSPNGAIELPVVLTDEVSEGVVAIPHGWGHRGGWRRANQAADGGGGVNVNLLMSSDPADVEPMAGMAQLTGIPIRLELVEAAPSAADEALAATEA
jgi:anaerobic selenocysteine-containing dehydrogenase